MLFQVDVAVVRVFEKVGVALDEGVFFFRHCFVDNGNAGAESLVAHIVGEVGNEGGMESHAFAKVAKACDDQMHGLVRCCVDLFPIQRRIDSSFAKSAKHVLCPLVFHRKGIQLKLLVDFGIEVEGLQQPKRHLVV